MWLMEEEEKISEGRAGRKQQRSRDSSHHRALFFVSLLLVDAPCCSHSPTSRDNRFIASSSHSPQPRQRTRDKTGQDKTGQNRTGGSKIAQSSLHHEPRQGGATEQTAATHTLQSTSRHFAATSSKSKVSLCCSINLLWPLNRHYHPCQRPCPARPKVLFSERVWCLSAVSVPSAGTCSSEHQPLG